MSRRERMEAQAQVSGFDTHLQHIMQEKGEVTLKALAMTFDLPPVRLYTVAKQPKEGMVYDAKVYNWEAIERFIVRRLGQEGYPNTLDEVVERALVIDAELKEQDGRRAANRGTSGGKKIEVDGKMVPERKYAHHEMKDADGNVNSNVQLILRKDPEVYKIVYQTRSHTVLVPVADAEGTPKSDLVKVISNGMLNLKGIGPVETVKGIEDRFSGKFLAEHPELAPEADAPTAE